MRVRSWVGVEQSSGRLHGGVERAAKASSNSSISTSPMMSGGAMRMVSSLAALTMRPCSSAAAATAVATGSVSATPMSRPRPRHPGDQRESSDDALAQLRAALGGVRDEPGALDLAEHGVGDRGRERVAAERRAVLALASRAGRRRAPKVTSAPIGNPPPMPFATVIASGVMPGVLEGEPLPRATRAGLDLVDDEERAVPLGELARGLEVAVGQVDDAGLALDRLDEERGDRVVDGRLERLDRGGDVLDARRSGSNGSCMCGLPVRASEPIVRPWNASSSARMRGRSPPSC